MESLQIRIITPESTLVFPRSYIKDNPLWEPCIVGTLFEKHFFGEYARSDELFLPYPKIIVDSLIEYFRDGNIRIDTKANRTELVKFLNYCAGDNAYMLDAAQQFKVGAMDIFGRKHERITLVKYKKYLNANGTVHYNESQSIRRNRITIEAAIRYNPEAFTEYTGRKNITCQRIKSPKPLDYNVSIEIVYYNKANLTSRHSHLKHIKVTITKDMILQYHDEVTSKSDS